MTLPLAVIGHTLTDASAYCADHELPQRLASSPRAVRNGALRSGRYQSRVLVLEGVELNQFDRSVLSPYTLEVVPRD